MIKLSYKHALPFLFLTLLLSLVFGCGGGGGTGGPGGSTGNNGVVLTAPFTTLAFGQAITITASVPGQADQTVIFRPAAGLQQNGPDTAVFTAPNAPGSATISAYADANSNLTGSITFSIVGIVVKLTPPGPLGLKPNAKQHFTATVQGATGSQSTAVTFSASAGTIVQTGPNAADYTAPAASGTICTVTAAAVANPQSVAVCQINVGSNSGNSAPVVGTITDDSGNPLSGITIQFFNSAGVNVLQAVVNNGSFNLNVPISAVSFNLTGININAEYNTFYFNGFIYNPAQANCNAPLPQLFAGQTVQLPPIVVPSTNGPPPPPPTGCH